jgi:hypothetical protein
VINFRYEVKGFLVAVFLAPFGFVPDFLLAWMGLDSRVILYGYNIITSTEVLWCASIDSLFSVVILAGIYALLLNLIYGSSRKILMFGVIYLCVYQFFHLAFLLSDTVITWKEAIERCLHYLNLYSFDEYPVDETLGGQRDIRDILLMLSFFIVNSTISTLITWGVVRACRRGGSRC